MVFNRVDIKQRKDENPKYFGKRTVDMLTSEWCSCEQFNDCDDNNIKLTISGLGHEYNGFITEETQLYNPIGACKDLVDGYCNNADCMRCTNIMEILFKAKYVAQVCGLQDYTTKYLDGNGKHRYKCKYYQTDECKFTNCMCCPIMQDMLKRVLLFEKIHNEIFATGDIYKPYFCNRCQSEECSGFCKLLIRFKNELIKHSDELR